MLKYIFIVMSICQIGGAEQYIYNKSKYLESEGYEVHIISGLNREIQIPGLKKYQSECLPCVMFLPSTFTNKERQKNLGNMIDIVGKDANNDTIIESNGIAEALWGELLASRLKCKNLYIDIGEYFNFDEEKKRYVLFKMKRNELYGISESSVSKMLGCDELYHYKKHINAACNNVVDDVEYPEINKVLFADHYTIGYMGRMAKECVLRITDEVSNYIRKEDKTKFNLFFIGTKDRKNQSYIDGIFQHLNNVDVYYTDSIYPIPRELIHKVDVFVSTAGSAYVTYYNGIPTIMVHPIKGYAIGVMGEDFSVGDDMYGKKSKYSIEKHIDRIRHKEAQIKFDNSYLENYNKDMIAEFDRQMLFVNDSDNTCEYYSYKNVKPSSSKEKLYSIIGKFVGANLLFSFVEFYRKRSA